ncbi:MAG: D-alanyl-D-alanine carboxypeptidase [Ruminiclostridium sp.]|nr:D-alanyl-D-alanine carboxypeptidase [Ruminiclostridium sp.]
MKKTLAYLLVIVFMLVNISVIPVFAANEDVYSPTTVMKIMNNTNVMSLKAKGAVLIDGASGTVLLESNSHARLGIASVTKVMSMLLIMEAIDSGKLTLDTKVTISEHSYRMGGSQVWLEPKEVFTVNELMEAVAIHSANDATVALAEAVAGSEDTFVATMNQKAKELGMQDTNFLDSTGLTDEGHYSSAHDIAIMSRELLLKYPKIQDFTTVWHSLFRNNTPGKKAVSLDNTNKLIHYYEGATGIKTGYTSKTGYSLSASAVRKGQLLIAVVLGETDSNTRFAEARKLLDYGFANFETTKVDNKGEEVQTAEVKKGLKMSVKAIYKDDVSLLLKKGDKSNLQKTVKIDKDITAPVQAGQKIGVMIYTIDGKEVGTAELVASEDVQKASFIRLFIKLVMEWFGIGRATI